MLIFIILAVLFHYILGCLKEDISTFNLNAFVKFLLENKLVVIFGSLALLTTYFLLPISKFFLLSLFSIVTVNAGQIIFTQSNKLVLVLLCFFLVSAYYLFVLWSAELAGPYYRSLYSNSDMEVIQKFKIEAICCDREGKEMGSGFLTNWSSNGLFLRFVGPINFKKRNVIVKLNFAGRIFSHEGQIVSVVNDYSGAGILLTETNNKNRNNFSWNELYSILYDSGFTPEYLV